MLKTKSIRFVANELNNELSFIDKTLMRMICLKMEMTLHWASISSKFVRKLVGHVIIVDYQ